MGHPGVVGFSIIKVSDFVSLDDPKVEHDVADLSATFQSADGDDVLGDLVSKKAQDHSLLAAATVNFEHQAITETGGNAWSFANTEIKNIVNQAPAHPAESDLPISTHDISRLEKDGDGKFAAWHSEQVQADLFQGTHQQAPVTAAKIGSSTAPSEVPIKTEAHNSPTSPTAVSGTSPAVLDNIEAQHIISSALHIDPQSLHPVVLAATSPAGAVQTTLSELKPAAGVSGSLATASTDTPAQPRPILAAWRLRPRILPAQPRPILAAWRLRPRIAPAQPLPILAAWRLPRRIALARHLPYRFLMMPRE